VHLGGGTTLGRQNSSMLLALQGAHISCPSWTKFSNAYEEADDEVLSGFLVLLWEHLGNGSFSPLPPDPWWSDLPQTRTYFFRFPRSVSFH
jgi:hypothetical protein